MLISFSVFLSKTLSLSLVSCGQQNIGESYSLPRLRQAYFRLETIRQASVTVLGMKDPGYRRISTLLERRKRLLLKLDFASVKTLPMAQTKANYNEPPNRGGAIGPD